jgi:hypothetical protein
MVGIPMTVTCSFIERVRKLPQFQGRDDGTKILAVPYDP